MKESLYHQYFIAEIRRRLIKECQARVISCLDFLSDEDIWYRPNTNSNSMGNLVLHLCGNVSQWLFSTLGGEADIRRRQAEFDEQGPISKTELKARIAALMHKADHIISEITPDQLVKYYRVQGFEENGVAILVHITEHFSYHVGQMTYFVKAHKNLDTGYYAGQDLDKTG